MLNGLTLIHVLSVQARTSISIANVVVIFVFNELVELLTALFKLFITFLVVCDTDVA